MSLYRGVLRGTVRNPVTEKPGDAFHARFCLIFSSTEILILPAFASDGSGQKNKSHGQEVIHVGPWNPKQPSSALLAVDYACPAPMSDRGSIIANLRITGDFLQTFADSLPRPSSTYEPALCT